METIFKTDKNGNQRYTSIRVEKLKDEMKSCDKLMDMVTKTYKEKTTIPQKQFKKIMKRDMYLDAQECIKYNVVDSID